MVKELVHHKTKSKWPDGSEMAIKQAKQEVAERLLDQTLRRKETRRDTTITIRSYGKFVDTLNSAWEDKGFRSRTHYVCSLIAKDMKWKGPF